MVSWLTNPYIPERTPESMPGLSADYSPAVAIETHGCKLNQADSADLAREFAQAGYTVASARDAVDVYVVNTCTVTHVADRKARHALRAARRRNPEATIVAAGCYPQRSPEALAALAEVDLVLGNTDKPSLVRRVGEWRGSVPVPCATGEEPELIAPRITRTRAMVKIQEGCDQVCAYCIVPKVRGRERSIPPDSILRTIRQRVSEGYKEVVLTGTQLGTYGFDLEGVGLGGLVERILKETEVVRLRVSSLQPQEIDSDFLSLWADSRLCPHFHMPLQSGSDAILRRMRRRYTRREYLDAVDLVRNRVSAVAITADVIAGFPGETEEQFAETYGLCEEIGFAGIHAFPYSPRPGTSAAHFDSPVPREHALDRVSRLISLGQTAAARFREGLTGSVRPVLWEEEAPKYGADAWAGMTDNYVKVVCSSPRQLANRITDARLRERVNGVVRVELL